MNRLQYFNSRANYYLIQYFPRTYNMHKSTTMARLLILLHHLSSITMNKFISWLRKFYNKSVHGIGFYPAMLSVLFLIAFILMYNAEQTLLQPI